MLVHLFVKPRQKLLTRVQNRHLCLAMNLLDVRRQLNPQRSSSDDQNPPSRSQPLNSLSNELQAVNARRLGSVAGGEVNRRG